MSSPSSIDDVKASKCDNTNTEKSTNAGNEDTSDDQHPTGARLALIALSLCMSTLLVALDATIIATAIPTITSRFDSLEDESWYNAAYLLTSCAFQLPFGRAYALLNLKWTFLISTLMFEVGSLVCATAPSSLALIIGRAIAGIGGAGIFGGSFIIIARNTPLRVRSLFNGFLGAVFGIAGVIGPLLGGVFTTQVTWRWCFYINLPIGALALFVIFICLPNTSRTRASEFKDKAWLQILNRFDILATMLLIPSIICLLLALQWGGVQYSWSNARVIVTFVLFGVSIIAWSILQVLNGDDATVPMSVICQRSVIGATFYAICGAASFTSVIYYLPTWLQAIKQVDAEKSGIDTLPAIISLVISSLAAGGLVAIFGQYVPFLYLGSICLTAGSALLMLLKPDSSTASVIGIQILFGVGVGVSLEQCNIAVQVVLPEDKIPAGISLAIFSRSLGGALAVSISQNVFQQKLKENLSSILPSSDISVISSSGATSLVANVQDLVNGNEAEISRIISLYNSAVTRCFLVSLVLAAMTFLGVVLVEYKSVKKNKKEDIESTGFVKSEEEKY